MIIFRQRLLFLRAYQSIISIQLCYVCIDESDTFVTFVLQCPRIIVKLFTCSLPRHVNKAHRHCTELHTINKFKILIRC